MILAIFDLQVTSMLPTMFQVNSVQEKKQKNRFSRWLPWGPLWISNRNDFSNFSIYKSPRCFLPSFESIGLLVQEKKPERDFQDGHHGSHLGFPIGTIPAIFDHKSTWCFLPSFESIGLSVQKKQKIDFQDGHHGRHLGFPIGTILAISNLQVTPMFPTMFQVN